MDLQNATTTLCAHDPVDKRLGAVESGSNGTDAVSVLLQLANLLAIDDNLRPAQLLALLSCSGQTGRNTFANQTALQFRDSPHHSKDRPSHWR